MVFFKSTGACNRCQLPNTGVLAVLNPAKSRVDGRACTIPYNRRIDGVTRWNPTTQKGPQNRGRTDICLIKRDCASVPCKLCSIVRRGSRGNCPGNTRQSRHFRFSFQINKFWQRNCRQNSQNDDDDHQLNQGKAFLHGHTKSTHIFHVCVSYVVDRRVRLSPHNNSS